jgi:hypothetical protein
MEHPACIYNIVGMSSEWFLDRPFNINSGTLYVFPAPAGMLYPPDVPLS